MIGQKLGPKRFDHWVRKFGFGKPTGVCLPGEGGGIVPAPKDYSGSSMGNLPIGQGLAVTPLQMAAGFSALANGGVLHRPHVVAGQSDPGKRVVSPKTAAQVARMLEGVLAAGGTAQEASIPGYKLAGKTGTAQKPDPENGGYSEFKFFSSFIGFAPAENPRLMVAVMVDEPTNGYYGGEVAAPAFEKIVSFALPVHEDPAGGMSRALLGPAAPRLAEPARGRPLAEPRRGRSCASAGCRWCIRSCPTPTSPIRTPGRTRRARRWAR